MGIPGLGYEYGIDYHHSYTLVISTFRTSLFFFIKYISFFVVKLFDPMVFNWWSQLDTHVSADGPRRYTHIFAGVAGCGEWSCCSSVYGAPAARPPSVSSGPCTIVPFGFPARNFSVISRMSLSQFLIAVNKLIKAPVQTNGN